MGSLPELGQQLLSKLAQDGEGEIILTLEDCLALWQMIDNSEIELSVVPDDPSIPQHPNQLKLAILDPISTLLWRRVELSRRQEDLDLVITFNTIGLQLTLGNDVKSAEWLGRLGVSYQYRFDLLGDFEDLGRAINFSDQAFLHTPLNDPGKAQRLNNLGGSYLSRFQRLGRLDDLDKSVGCLEQAVMLTPDGHPDKPAMLTNLGNSYPLLFERLGRLDDLDKS
ncbi:hypothetical protein FS749_006638, partial [Ceratobasidium sp. UAMH 11750]